MISPSLLAKAAKVVELVANHGPGAVSALERLVEASNKLAEHDPAAMLAEIQAAERKVNGELAKAEARKAALG